jgi:hypothetical protein
MNRGKDKEFTHLSVSRLRYLLIALFRRHHVEEDWLTAVPRLYVEWAQGLFEASSAVQLEYRISEQLRLKARSGTSQSMDLIYEIETD